MIAKSPEPDLPGIGLAHAPRSTRPARRQVIAFSPRPARTTERRSVDLGRLVAETCLGELAEPYRIAIRLCDVEGLSTTEVAARLSLSPDLAAARIAHGRRLLAQAVCRRCRPMA